MPLNIEDERVTQLAAELAAQTGESITVAVRISIEERLERMRRKGLSEKLLEIGRKSAPESSREWLDHDFDAESYDDRGLPRSLSIHPL